MKKTLTISMLLVLLSAFATQAQIKLGAHLGYATDISNVWFWN